MKHLLALTLLLLALSACKKHTEYSGTVLSSADGKPVAGARVRLVFGISTGPGESELSASDEMTTDSSGTYLVSCEVKRYDTRNFLAEKEGFIKFQKLPETNTCEKLDIILDPLDAWLGLEIENTRDDVLLLYPSITGEVLALTFHKGKALTKFHRIVHGISTYRKYREAMIYNWHGHLK